MPYTPVHALVALPFARDRALPALPARVRRRAVPALAAGSMVPDAPIFFDVLWPGADELGHVTHGLPAALTLDVALALAVTALWVQVVGPAVRAALPRRGPAALDAALREGAPGQGPGAVGANATTATTVTTATRERVRGALVVVGFALAGVLTHLAWDDVTHLRGHAVQAWSLLREPLGGRPLYGYLQHGTSAAGVLALLGVGLWWWRRAEPVAAPQHLRSAVVSLAVGAAAGLLGAVARLAVEPGGVTLYALARRSATYPLLGAALALVVWAIVVRSRRWSAEPDVLGVR